MKVNQITVTIYDNKPNLQANQWYDNSTDPAIYKNRYVLQMDFLNSGSNRRLRSSLGWPPNQFRRLEYWQHNRLFYEQIAEQARQLQMDIRAGRIPARLPALIAIPNQNQKLKNKRGQNRYSWHMPIKPSAIIAVKEYVNTTHYRWHLQWLAPDFYRSFVIDQAASFKLCNESTSVSSQYPGPWDIQDELVTCRQYANMTLYNEKDVDPEYQQWRGYIIKLNENITPMNRLILEAEYRQNPEYYQALLKEFT